MAGHHLSPHSPGKGLGKTALVHDLSDRLVLALPNENGAFVVCRSATFRCLPIKTVERLIDHLDAYGQSHLHFFL